MDEVEAKGLWFVGSGVSGGEEGARYGPSLSKLAAIGIALHADVLYLHSARWIARRMASH